MRLKTAEKEKCKCGFAVHELHNTLRAIVREAYKPLPELRVHNELVRLANQAEAQIFTAEKMCGVDLDLAKRAVAVIRTGIKEKSRQMISAEADAARSNLGKKLQDCITPPPKYKVWQSKIEEDVVP